MSTSKEPEFPHRPLEGRVALVTGAGRLRGLGCAIAVRLARAGADVVVTDIAATRGDLTIEPLGLGDSPETLEQVADLVRKHGVRSTAIPLDITNQEQAASAIETTIATHGRLDILVNNAGTPVGIGEFATGTDSAWDLAWQVNVLGTARMCRLALPHLTDTGVGSIINIASAAGLGGVAGMGAYTVTKHALVGLTRLLAAELGPKGIRVNAVAPNYIKTDMGDAELLLMALELGVSVEEAQQVLTEQIPLRRLGEADDVADTVAWLASGAGFVNGAIVPVGGGSSSGLT